MTGSRTCRVHGGKSATGALSPQYKHGKYTKSLQGPLLGKYEDTKEANQAVLDMSDELHLLDSRLMELAAAVSVTDAGATFEDVGVALVELRGLVDRGTFTPEQLIERLDEVNGLVANGWDREEQWSEILKTVEIRKKVVEAEIKRAMLSRSSIPVEKVKDFLNTFREQFRQSCLAHADPTTANAILSDASARCNRMVNARF